MRDTIVRYFFCFTIFIFLIGVYVHLVHAEMWYVSDNMIITMRSGMGKDYRIIKNLKTGTPLEVIEESEEYMKVRTKDGEEG